MTRDETKKILMVIECSYANWKPKGDLGFMVDIWHDYLADYPYSLVYNALKAYTQQNTTGFAPDAGQLIAFMQSMADTEVLDESQAWAKVSKALENGIYGSESEFEKLPPLVQKAVGSARQLRVWAMDSDYNESVISSNFKRAYRTIADREKSMQRVSPQVLEMLRTENKIENKPNNIGISENV